MNILAFNSRLPLAVATSNAVADVTPVPKHVGVQLSVMN